MLDALDSRHDSDKPLFTCAWDRVLMIHYEVDPALLQPAIPFPLDCFDDRAYVSLVAFTIRGMRLNVGGPFTAWLTAPIATHEFLNVRTYIRRGNEAGIYFMAEWLPNRLSVLLGPRVFGLPYRLGGLEYDHNHQEGSLRGTITADDGAGVLRYIAQIPEVAVYSTPDRGSLTEFLMERYAAFTQSNDRQSMFRVWHDPWQQTAATVSVQNEGLLELSGRWNEEAELVCANYCPGLTDVGMGWPIRLRNRTHEGQRVMRTKTGMCRPFRASDFIGHRYPGRCPGLTSVGPSGQKTLASKRK